MKDLELAKRLQALGFMDRWDGKKKSLTARKIKGAIRRYQTFHGLYQRRRLEIEGAKKSSLAPPSGELDSATLRHLNLPRICRHPDVMPVRQANRQWPTWPSGQIKWTLANSFDPIKQSDVVGVGKWAFHQWTSRVPGVQAEYTTRLSDAHVRIWYLPIDQAGGVLGDMELPDGTWADKRMRLDKHEIWLFFEGAPPERYPGAMDLGRVLAHEIGHAFGLYHFGSGLMAPTYGTHRHPTYDEVAVLREMYPAATDPDDPPPDPPPDDPPSEAVTIQLQADPSSLIIPGYRVVPV